MSALGLVETIGLVAAIEAADAMLKAANVHLLERNQVGSGLVTITVAGEVSAVKASVDAAAAAVKRLNPSALCSQHVIARPDAELGHVLALAPLPSPRQSSEHSFGSKPAIGVAVQAKEQGTPHDISQLKKMSLEKLRQVAKTVQGLLMTAEKAASANKKDLIEAIVTAHRQREE